MIALLLLFACTGDTSPDTYWLQASGDPAQECWAWLSDQGCATACGDLRACCNRESQECWWEDRAGHTWDTCAEYGCPEPVCEQVCV